MGLKKIKEIELLKYAISSQENFFHHINPIKRKKEK